MTGIFGLTLAASILLGAMPLTALAQHRTHDRMWRGDIRHFDRYDAHQWRSGDWRHGSHGGRIGWWWVTGGVWYFHPQPVYPYPDPYRPPLVVVESSPQPPVTLQPAAQFWYYCELSSGYYPYVPSCPSGWKTVPATPPGAPQ
jgi:hypothetical protein